MSWKTWAIYFALGVLVYAGMVFATTCLTDERTEGICVFCWILATPALMITALKTGFGRGNDGYVVYTFSDASRAYNLPHMEGEWPPSIIGAFATGFTACWVTALVAIILFVELGLWK